MRKVLVVAFYFPPLGGGGVQRTLKFVRYLPEFGWQPIVLTVKPRTTDLWDASLEAEVPSNIRVYRTRALLYPHWFPWKLRRFVSRWLLPVDQQLGWLPFAVRDGRRAIQLEGVDAIFTTAAPYTDHLIGLQLKRSGGLPWLADFRDPWIGNFSLKFPTTFHERLARRLERHVIEASDQIIVVSEPMRQALLARHPGLGPDQVLTLPNGYDPQDFEGNEPLSQQAGRMVFVHTGSFYGQRQTPAYLLQGLRTALEERLVPRQRIQVLFVGNVDPSIRRQIQELDLADVVQVTGYLPHRQSIGHLLGADVLLLIIGTGPGSEAVFTGKIFEYLAAHKPIMALVPKGVAAALIQEARAGVLVDPENVAAIAKQISIFYQRWQRSELKSTSDPQVVARYDRRHLTTRLAEALNELIRRSSDGD